MNPTLQFFDIVNANFTDKELASMTAPTDNTPKITPGEGSAFGLAALLIGTGLLSDMAETVQLACIAGGVLLGCVGTFATKGIRVARNEASAVRAVADAETVQASLYASAGGEDEDGE